MATVKSRFDASSTPTTPVAEDGPWLSTYSRALCSIYPKDEDDCFDYLLSTQPSSIFPKLPENSIPSNARKSEQENTTAEEVKRSFTPTLTLPSSFPEAPLVTNRSTGGITIGKGDEIVLAPMSPGSISHALCKFGFDCIDYFTATQDDLSEPPKPSSNSASRPTDGFGYTSPLLEDLTDRDWKTGLAAAVCGKRTAALERKRALSRSSSQVDITAGAGSIGNSPWFETLDRLSRWDEVAYR
ncbi:hypothetical protein B0O80DRAFT_448433 [Mortierella sp. GBAus27b]|nr:hypothetical protein BGX31_003065 [Mortierella sp. GBA43]KAI8355972.1 hypothetical protein B0O80DRAFT_448433 [Mortierella sp. GBAus27b]